MNQEIEIEEIEIVSLEDYFPTKSERPIVERYIKALLDKDSIELDYLRCMGRSVHHRILNIHAHEGACLFGYKKIAFDKHGWLKREEWMHTYNIVFLPNDDKAKSNRIELAQGANGKWTWGYSYSFGAGAGGADSPSFYGDICENKEEAIKISLQFFHERFIQASRTDDSTNYNQKVVSDMLKAIKTQMLLNDVSPLAQAEPTFEMQAISNPKFTASPQLALFGGTQLSF